MWPFVAATVMPPSACADVKPVEVRQPANTRLELGHEPLESHLALMDALNPACFRSLVAVYHFITSAQHPRPACSRCTVSILDGHQDSSPRLPVSETADETADADPQPPTQQLPRVAPASYLHWHDLREPAPDEIIVEYPLYSDAHILERKASLGPFTVLNAFSFNQDHDRAPAMFLRVRFREFERERPDMNSTNDEHYHGGGMLDEVAALLSLECSMRVFASHSETRRFTPGSDPLGDIEQMWFGRRPPTIRRKDGRYIVPLAAGEHNIVTGTRLLSRYPELEAQDAVALVKAARLFQEALWLAEGGPELAWLLLASAIETAATHRKRELSPAEVLRLAKPELAERLLEKGGEDLVQEIAEMFANQSKSTAKFVDFLAEFQPPLREPRPPEWSQVTPSKKLYKKVYKHRSNALHSGKPFPAPMCEAPIEFGDPPFKGTITEKPGGSASAYGTASWQAKDTPILLNTFVYLVRGALLNWWESMLPPGSV
jgi:hypothetical protein